MESNSDNKNKVYSGIRATGRLHLGNYFGAVKGMLELQDKYDCAFSVVDLHVITTPYDPSALQNSVRDVVLDYLAAGLDPQKCLIEIQSKVPEHTELAYLLSTIYPVSRLEDLPTYKDKKAQFPKYVNMGLLYYPVLMAADILLYKADLVPVGIDQEPHIEVTREIARKFNSTYGETFPEPQRFKTSGEYVPSLTGEGKMAKSIPGSYINLTDDLDTIISKVAKIPTDIGKGTIQQFQGEPMTLERYEHYDKSHTKTQKTVATLMTFVELFQGIEKKKEYEIQYTKGEGIKYSELKKELAESIFNHLKPIQAKRAEIESSFDLDGMLNKHAEICREVAKETLTEVKRKMGLI